MSGFGPPSMSPQKQSFPNQQMGESFRGPMPQFDQRQMPPQMQGGMNNFGGPQMHGGPGRFFDQRDFNRRDDRRDHGWGRGRRSDRFDDRRGRDDRYERDFDKRDRDGERRDRSSEKRRKRHSRSRSGSSSRSRSRSRSDSAPRRRKKRTSNWDQGPGTAPAPAAAAPVGSGGGFTAAPPVGPAMPPAPVAPSAPSIHPARLSMIQQALPTADMSAGTGSAIGGGGARQVARRLYFGNLPLPVAEEDLKQFICQAMRTSRPTLPPGDPVVSVYINTQKKFSFIEFRSPEEATLGMNLDGINFQGSSLRVRRPSDYTPPLSTVGAVTAAPVLPPMTPMSVLPSNIQATIPAATVQVADSPNKLFCGGLHTELTDEEAKELLCVYGSLKSFHLVRHPVTNQSKGYCFFEYHDGSMTDFAILGLNGLDVKGKSLTVRRAHTPGAAAAVPSAPRMAQVQSSMPTRVLCLTNMVTPQELGNDQEYREIVEDVDNECRKYGNVKALDIPRPMASGQAVPGLGKIFVEFETLEQCERAKVELEGRQFGNNIVEASYFSEQRFMSQDYGWS